MTTNPSAQNSGGQLSSPSKLPRDVRLHVRTPSGPMLTTPMTYYDACCAHRAFREMGVAEEDIITITDTRTLRNVDAEKKAAGQCQSFAVATILKPDGTIVTKSAIGPVGQTVCGDPITECCDPSIECNAGQHPHCGAIPTGTEAVSKEAMIVARHFQDAAVLATDRLSTLGLIVLVWTCLQILAVRVARAILGV